MKLTSSSFEPPLRSVWQATAGEAPEYPALAASRRVDVAVIGAGYCGLVAALELRDAGVDVAVVDVGQPGNGGSGRNGGQVWPGLKMLPAQMQQRFGTQAAAAMAGFAARAADAVFERVTRLGLDCEAQPGGVIRAAHSRAALQGMLREAEPWQAAGDDIEPLDAARAQALIGSPRYVGGLLHRRGGAVHPLRYARELARVAAARGAAVHGASRVTRLQRDGGAWTLAFDDLPGKPALRAERVLIATDAYTGDLLPGLSRSLIPLFSFQIATRPLPTPVWAEVCPGGLPVSDSQKLLRYFRRGPGQRLLMGGRAPFKEQPQIADAARLRAYVREVFPQLGDVDVEFCWGGRVGMTTDHIPRLTRPAPGVLAALGFNGFGVGLATAFGGMAGALLARETPPDYPVTPLQTVPLHAAHQLPVRALIAAYTLMETLS